MPNATTLILVTDNDRMQARKRCHESDDTIREIVSNKSTTNRTDGVNCKRVRFSDKLDSISMHQEWLPRSLALIAERINLDESPRECSASPTPLAERITASYVNARVRWKETPRRQRKSGGMTEKRRSRETERERGRTRRPLDRVTGSLFPIPSQSKINLSSYS